MPFKYITTNETKTGDLSIIPSIHHEAALIQKKNSIECYNKGWYCPILIVDIGESITYIVD